jgi:hypothetical protein
VNAQRHGPDSATVTYRNEADMSWEDGREEMPQRRKSVGGRPPNPDTSPENVRLDLRITAEQRRRIRHAAADADMGLGAWVKLAIEEKLERQERTQ